MSIRSVDIIIIRVRHPAFADLALHRAELPGARAKFTDPADSVGRLCRHDCIECAPGRDVQHPLDTVLDLIAVRDHAARNPDDDFARVSQFEKLDTQAVEAFLIGPLQSRRQRLRLLRSPNHDAIRGDIDLERFRVASVRGNRDNRRLAVLINDRDVIGRRNRSDDADEESED